MSQKRRFPSEDQLDALFDEVNSAGRWGEADELGTLNFITPEKRISAATLVREGRALSIARDVERARRAWVGMAGAR